MAPSGAGGNDTLCSDLRMKVLGVKSVKSDGFQNSVELMPLLFEKKLKAQVCNIYKNLLGYNGTEKHSFLVR